jgi:RNA polymerase sigma-70 factor (ECF subfamily)
VDVEDLKREVRGAARGNQDSAAALFDHLYPRVYRYASARLSNRQDAEDVAAETFAKVLRGLDRFRWRGNGFEAWVFRIAKNLIIDRYRVGDREVVGDELVDSVLPVQVDGPEAGVLAGEQRDDLTRMIERLPDEQREVVLLRFAGELDTHEVAAATNRNANAVRQLQFRALTNLRKWMDDE